MLKIEPKKIKLSWDDVSTAVDKVCEIILPEIANVDSIHGISRGGLIPAVMEIFVQDLLKKVILINAESFKKKVPLSGLTEFTGMKIINCTMRYRGFTLIGLNVNTTKKLIFY